MEVKQVYTLLNNVVKETMGETAVVQEDLTGLVELGTSIENAIGYDKYVKSLVNHIGKVIIICRQNVRKSQIIPFFINTYRLFQIHISCTFFR